MAGHARRQHFQQELRALEAAGARRRWTSSSQHARPRRSRRWSTRTSSSRAMVIADDDRIDGRYLEVHQGILSLLALQAPVAADLRVVAALLHVIKHVERMGDQCVNIAKLLPMTGHEPPVRRGDARRASSGWARWRAREVVQCQAGVRGCATSRSPRTWSARTRRSTSLNRECSSARSRSGPTPTARVGDDDDAGGPRASSGSATTPSTSASRWRSWSRGCSAEFSDASRVGARTRRRDRLSSQAHSAPSARSASK